LSSPKETFDLLVVGDCNPDLLVHGADVVPEFGQAEKLVDGMSLMIGGSAAITAVAAARLGLRVALVAAVGDDPAGELMLSLLASAGVDTSAVLVRPGLPTGMTTVLSTGADRAILTAPGAMTSLTAADVPTLGARHLHVSSYFLLERSLGPGLAGLLAAARRRGLTISLDTNYDPARRWGDRLLRAALAETDVFLPNEAEALGISGESDVGKAAAALSALGVRSLVIKLGARGALCGPDGPLVSVPTVEPVDTTGAGDCFNAGLIAGLLDGLDLPHAAALGCAVGAASTAAAGGTGAVVDRTSAGALAAEAIQRPVANDNNGPTPL
jgi:sugar/nucleoside kinase (ribokinase family)